jgi:hypothetical protein
LSRVRPSRSFQRGRLRRQGSHLGGDLVQPDFEQLDPARDRPVADEPAAIVARVEVAGGEVAAHEAFAGDGRAMVTQGFERVALDLAAENQIHKRTGG